MSDPYGPPPGHPGDVPAEPSQEDRTWALTAHIGALLSAYVALGLLAPLIVMLIKSDNRFVRRHAVESLNFQISLLIYAVVGTVVGLVVGLLTFGIALFVIVPLVVLVGVAVLVLIILATVRAGNGQDYRYPLTIRFIR